MAKGSLWLTRSYNFIDRDPEIDVFRTAWQDEGITLNQLAVLSGLANVTVHKLFGPKAVTRRPQHATFGKLAGAMGYVYGLTRPGGKKPNYTVEIPIAVAQRREYRAAAAAAKAKTHKRSSKKKNGKKP